MVNEEIVGGIISGMERGESIQKAMITLYNSGYKKEEIEEAAAIVVSLGIKTKEIVQPVLSQPLKIEEKPKDTKLNSSQINPQTFNSPLTNSNQLSKENTPFVTQSFLTSSNTKKSFEKDKTLQKVSNYSKDPPKEKIMIVLLIALLVFLVGILVAIFLFKDELINFFSTFFV